MPRRCSSIGCEPALCERYHRADEDSIEGNCTNLASGLGRYLPIRARSRCYGEDVVLGFEGA